MDGNPVWARLTSYAKARFPDFDRWLGELSSLLHPENLPPPVATVSAPTVIIAGGTSGPVPFADIVQRAFEGFRGSIISGGTDAGVAGLAGSLASPHITAIGYLPAAEAARGHVDARYSQDVLSDAEAFSPADAIAYWRDILSSGISAQDVRLVAIGGGPIAAFEYRLALALGAYVGVLCPADREAAVLLADPDWQFPQCLPLPADAMSLRAFIEPSHSALSSETLEGLAKRMHAAYQAKADPEADAAKPWDELPEDFRTANRSQALAAVSLMERAGLQIDGRRAFAPADVERLAEMEHGRWVVDRLEQGWRFGNIKDVSRKLHPDLIPWAILPDATREWDRRAVAQWPELFAQSRSNK